MDGDYVNVCDDASECTEDSCKGPDGCINVPVAGDCDDGNECTLNDTCTNGACIGQPLECDDDNPCTDNECTAGQCFFPPNDEHCDDGSECTVADICQDGECLGVQLPCECTEDVDCLDQFGAQCNGAPFCNTDQIPYKCELDPETAIECPLAQGPNAFCLQPMCDEATGECGLEPDHEGFLCNNGDVCTLNDTCIAGVCGGGEVFPCLDGNPCTEDSCDPNVGCVFPPEPDGTECFVAPGWECQNGQCVATCQPDCAGKECGDNGCGGQCGNCPDGEYCAGTTCLPICEPSCEDKTCGPDGCGGFCGVCLPGQACIAGNCPSNPNAECDDGNDIDWDGCTDGKISEWLVNITPGGMDSDAASFSDGRFVVVWTSSGQTGSNILRMVFGADGEPITSEQAVNEFGCLTINGGSGNTTPSVAVSADGQMATAWVAPNANPSKCKLPCGFNQAVLADWDLAGLPSGDICVDHDSSGDAGLGVWTPDVAAQDDTFVAVWVKSTDGPNEVYASALTATNLMPPKVKLNASESAVYPAVAALPDGRFVATWRIWGGSMVGHFLAPDGTKWGSEFGIASPPQEQNALAALPDGGFALAVVGTDQNPGDYAVELRVFDDEGLPTKPPLLVNEYTEQGQMPTGLASFADGSMVVVWSSNGQDGDGWGAYGRVVSADGDFLTDEFQVNTYTTSEQTPSAVVTFADDTFIVVFESSSQASGGWDIFAQRFDKDGNKLYK